MLVAQNFWLMSYLMSYTSHLQLHLTQSYTHDGIRRVPGVSSTFVIVRVCLL